MRFKYFTSLIVFILMSTFSCSQVIPVDYNKFHIQNSGNAKEFEVGEAKGLAYTYVITNLDSLSPQMLLEGVVYVEHINYDGFTDKYTCGEPGVRFYLADLEAQNKLEVIQDLGVSNKDGTFSFTINPKDLDTKYVLFVKEPGRIDYAYHIPWIVNHLKMRYIEKDKFECSEKE